MLVFLSLMADNNRFMAPFKNTTGNVLPSSVSDNGEYPVFCASAAADDKVFRTFKSHPSYTLTLEHVTPEEGLECLKMILSGDGALAGLLDKFKDNDRYGSPPLFDYGAYGRFSPTTLRYVKILEDLRNLFGDLNGKHIVEIGGGYGGQCQIITSFFNVASYTVYDLAPVAALIRKYWDKNGVRANVNALPFSELRAGMPCDLVISNYAFSECIEEVREMYLDKLILRAPAGYMICNYFDEPTRAGIARRIPGAKMIAEKPQTAPDNFVLVWGHREVAPVAEYRRNITSQFGEDGILEEIFCRLGEGGKLCVEFGASDGKAASNTWNLWANRGWSAVLIETDAALFSRLLENTRGFASVTPVHAHITVEPGMLDSLLDPALGGRKPDLMSIDIDSDDYAVFAALEKYLPRVLIVEYNPSIPPEFHFIQKPGEYAGNSARAIHFLALKKGYTLVAMTHSNMIFVQNGEFGRLRMKKPLLEELFPVANLTYVMTPYASVPLVNRAPVYSTLDSRIYRKPLPKFEDHHSWIPVHIAELGLAKSRELAVQTPFWNKQRILHDDAHLYLIDTFIETGAGEKMTEACGEYFRRTFRAAPGELAGILKNLSEPAAFWINNPFTPGAPDPARMQEIREEFRMILAHPVKGHIVLIDHARLFNGEDGYLHIDRLEEDFRALRPGDIFHVREDILRVYPPVFPSLKRRILHKLKRKFSGLGAKSNKIVAGMIRKKTIP